MCRWNSTNIYTHTYWNPRYAIGYSTGYPIKHETVMGRKQPICGAAGYFSTTHSIRLNQFAPLDVWGNIYWGAQRGDIGWHRHLQKCWFEFQYLGNRSVFEHRCKRNVCGMGVNSPGPAELSPTTHSYFVSVPGWDLLSSFGGAKDWTIRPSSESARSICNGRDSRRWYPSPIQEKMAPTNYSGLFGPWANCRDYWGLWIIIPL